MYTWKIEQAGSKVNQQIEQVKALLIKEPDLSVRQVAKILKVFSRNSANEIDRSKKTVGR